MGHILLSSRELTSTISEAAGYKTGLALGKKDLYDLFPEDSQYKEIFNYSDDSCLRLHSYDVDELFTHVLFYLGNIESPTPMSHTLKLFHKYKNNPDKLKKYQDIQRLYISFMLKVLKNTESTRGEVIDPTDFMRDATLLHGRDGLSMSYELVIGNVEEMHYRLSSCRRIEWENTIELKDLFSSESLDTKYGRFLDQRYIDYLNRNGFQIKKMHWRKFEGLTAEYFEREGYSVELGSGRNDGGVDIRVWNNHKDTNDPPLILIQCKRHKEKIDRTVVKALWADTQHEGAASGLIVTTSSISSGAKKDCKARGYNISEANGKTIETWLEKMKSPGAGVFMGE